MISIITITKNDEKGLSLTLASILNQKYADFECIVVYSSSSDSTLKIASDFSHRDERIRIINQQSLGITNAFNEGIAQSRGDWLIFLNSGDRFINETSLEMLIQETKNGSSDVICARSLVVSSNSREPLYEHGPQVSSCIKNQLKKSCVISHPATLIKSDCFKKYGLYSPIFKIAMDYDFWLRLADRDCTFHTTDCLVAEFTHGGISTTSKWTSRFEAAIARRMNHSSRNFKDAILFFLSGLFT